MDVMYQPYSTYFPYSQRAATSAGVSAWHDSLAKKYCETDVKLADYPIGHFRVPSLVPRGNSCAMTSSSRASPSCTRDVNRQGGATFEAKDGVTAKQTEYLSDTCVILSYHTTDVASAVDEHFTRALSGPSSFTPDRPGTRPHQHHQWRGVRSSYTSNWMQISDRQQQYSIRSMSTATSGIAQTSSSLSSLSSRAGLASSLWSGSAAGAYSYHHHLVSSSQHAHPTYFNKDFTAVGLGYGSHQLADPYPSLFHPHLQASARLGALQCSRPAADDFSSWRYPSLAAAAAAAAHTDYPYHSSLGSQAPYTTMFSPSSRLQPSTASSSAVAPSHDMVSKRTDTWASYNERLNSAFTAQHPAVHSLAGSYEASTAAAVGKDMYWF